MADAVSDDPADKLSTEGSEDVDVLDLADDEGWDDVEPDIEVLEFKCLLCDQIYNETKSLLEHLQSTHHFNLLDIQERLRLDFLGMIKLVNYIRLEVKAGNGVPRLATNAEFEDDRYLKPAIEDDALLYNLHDLADIIFEVDQIDQPNGPNQVEDQDGEGEDSRFADLEKKLHHAQQEIEARKVELEAIRRRFGDPVSNGPEERVISYDPMGRKIDTGSANGVVPLGNTDSSYFDSYSGHEIHETMLKDVVRTNAYRDFIYENKHLFKDKVVLDVGCGTGILSMFCARAGASRVIAVDNSNIIDFARENVYKNNFGEVISCLRGKIEEVSLPVTSVDIIVSEWMGYCLLYEAMLESVLWARDQYLKPEGLMIPSHCTLRIATYSDSEYIEEHVDHWSDVYGFDMSSMQRDIHSDARVRQVQDFTVSAGSVPFLSLALKTASADELAFRGKSFEIDLDRDMGALDGFVIWFDTFFLSAHDGHLPPSSKAEECRHLFPEVVAFTTGPHGKGTHWQQVALLIDNQGKQPIALKKGQIVEGTIGYQKRRDDNRALDIDVQWRLPGISEQQSQKWAMR